MHYPVMVFSDFDGTITENETLRAMFLKLLPEQAPGIIAQLDEGKLSLRQTLVQLTGLLPANAPERMLQLIEHEPLRPGFNEFVDLLHERKIPLVVISSGLRFYVEAVLSPWRNKIHAIHALNTQVEEDHLELILDYEDENEAVPKADIMLQYSCDTHVAVGDSQSDFKMAQAADVVFARDKLLMHLRGSEQPVHAYQSFFEINTVLQERLNTHGHFV